MKQATREATSDEELVSAYQQYLREYPPKPTTASERTADPQYRALTDALGSRITQYLNQAAQVGPGRYWATLDQAPIPLQERYSDACARVWGSLSTFGQKRPKSERPFFFWVMRIWGRSQWFHPHPEGIVQVPLEPVAEDGEGEDNSDDQFALLTSPGGATMPELVLAGKEQAALARRVVAEVEELARQLTPRRYQRDTAAFLRYLRFRWLRGGTLREWVAFIVVEPGDFAGGHLDPEFEKAVAQETERLKKEYSRFKEHLVERFQSQCPGLWRDVQEDLELGTKTPMQKAGD